MLHPSLVMSTIEDAEVTRAARTISPGDTLRPYHWRWWTVVLRGIVAVLFGLFALFAPASAFVTFVVLFGVYALIDGVLALGFGLGERRYHRGTMVARGLVSIAAGLIALFWPGQSALALLIVIGAWAIASGILEIVLAIRMRKELTHEWLLGIEGGLSIAFGVLLLLGAAGRGGRARPVGRGVRADLRRHADRDRHANPPPADRVRVASHSKF